MILIGRPVVDDGSEFEDGMFVVDLTEELKGYLRRKVSAAKALKKLDESFYCTEYRHEGVKMFRMEDTFEDHWDNDEFINKWFDYKWLEFPDLDVSELDEVDCAGMTVRATVDGVCWVLSSFMTNGTPDSPMLTEERLKEG